MRLVPSLTVTPWWSGVILATSEYLAVMSSNMSFDVIHASVRQFDCVPVTYFVQCMISGEAFFDDLEKFSSNICFHIAGPGWIEPGDSPVPVLPPSIVVVVPDVRLELQLIIVTTVN